MATTAKLRSTLWAGLGLIRRQPLAVLAWGIVFFAATMAPTVVYYWIAGPTLVGYYRDLMAGNAPTTLVLSPWAGLIQLWQFVGSVVGSSVVLAAIYRAVIRPENKGLAYLRLGKDELRVGLVWVVLYILFAVALVVAMIVLAVPTGLLIAFTGDSQNPGQIVWLVAIVTLILCGVTLVPMVRLGMAVPMTFADRQIRIFEAWNFTKGYTVRLLALAGVQLVVALVIYVVAYGSILAAFAGTVGSLDPDSIRAFVSNPDVLSRLIPVFACVGVVYILMAFLMTPLLVAPWARVYQLIAGEKSDDRLALFD